MKLRTCQSCNQFTITTVIFSLSVYTVDNDDWGRGEERRGEERRGGEGREEEGRGEKRRGEERGQIPLYLLVNNWTYMHSCYRCEVSAG